MPISQAQVDMRHAYYSGAAGILASAIAWAVAAAVAVMASEQKGIWALLIGGMLIMPLALVIGKVLGASGKHSKGNPLGELAGASTFWLIFSLLLAYGLGLQNPAWFFAAMLLTIGGRYLVFATLYGMRLYWVLGLALAGAGYAVAFLNASASIGAIAGAAIEAVFAVVCMAQHRRWLRLGGFTQSESPSAAG